MTGGNQILQIPRGNFGISTGNVGEHGTGWDAVKEFASVSVKKKAPALFSRARGMYELCIADKVPFSSLGHRSPRPTMKSLTTSKIICQHSDEVRVFAVRDSSIPWVARPDGSRSGPSGFFHRTTLSPSHLGFFFSTSPDVPSIISLI